MRKMRKSQRRNNSFIYLCQHLHIVFPDDFKVLLDYYIHLIDFLNKDSMHLLNHWKEK